MGTYAMSEKIGICTIKPEFIIPEQVRTLDWNCVSAKDKETLQQQIANEKVEDNKKIEHNENNNTDEPPNKKSKKNKKHSGQNKKRGPSYRRELDKELCNSVIDIPEGTDAPQCLKNNCPFMHDVHEYLKNKPEDIGKSCYVFEKYGHCPRGVSCRFGSGHLTPTGHNITIQDDSKQKRIESVNVLTNELQWKLKKRSYDFSLSEKLIKYNDKLYNAKRSSGNKTLDTTTPSETSNQKTLSLDDSTLNNTTTTGSVTDEDLIVLLSRERRTIDFRGKIFLSPLTTVGNLPFRRICKEFGVDVTCGEMALCTSLLQGAPQEWALLRRHPSEDLFGVQLCAHSPHLLTKVGQLIRNHISVDFVDVNLGCPIDLIYRSGAGCGLIRRPRLLELCIRNLVQSLDVPVTVKTRTGVYSGDNVAHKLVPQFREWGAELVTVHGRSREQRYTRTADWTYIRQCADTVTDNGGMAVLGNGDVLGWEDWKKAMEQTEDGQVSGVMIGRGALIKPWIFTEIKEQRLWDIRSSERFDILRKYTNYGLEHWGSDNKGVENTRRFMLEWLSFLYRYVPVGLLEQPPQHINERPPYYKGRDDLETLMASPSCTDWIKMSEMLLGPVPQNFTFIPKHKANSYK